MKVILSGNYIVYKNGTIEKTNGGKIRFYNLNGYKTFNYKGKTYYVHRLVAETFINNFDELPCVNHIDGNKQNNNINNLEWVSYSENNKHAYRTGLKKSVPKTNKHKSVCMLNNEKEIICIFPKQKYANIIFKKRIDANIIRAIKTGTKCNGYYWRYVNE